MGARLTTPRIVWAALLASQGIYVGIMLGGLLPRPPAPPDPIMLYALAAVALAVSAASFAVPMIVRRAAIASAVADLRHHEASLETIQSRALAIGFTPLVLSLALSEAVALFGLVLFAIGFPLAVSAPFHAVGAMLTLVRYPTVATFIGPFEEALGRTLR